MRTINSAEFINDQLSREQLIDSRINLITRQIEGYEKLMEGAQSLVKCVNSYNLCASLVEQLKYHSSAAFFDPIENMEKAECKPAKELTWNLNDD